MRRSRDVLMGCRSNKTSRRCTTETSWQRSIETSMGVSLETYLRRCWDVQRDVLTTSPQRLATGWVVSERNTVIATSINKLCCLKLYLWANYLAQSWLVFIISFMLQTQLVKIGPMQGSGFIYGFISRLFKNESSSITY